ncbi:type VII secretion integral membrane protein EccD [Kocuria sp.]|uniref:type VII secretion integral membrane protein EccD n=1 Tax=Kocuria sp. TaxID=1871328 RepID=UPI0026DF1061|nr:type VII secretion integral membrane protein EccD [Kocuria sp.]
MASQKRNVELLLPSNTPVGALMPSVLDLLKQGPDPELRRMGLSPLGEAALDEQRSLAESNVVDGSVLLLTAREDSVPSPVVYDIADHAALMRTRDPGRWSRDGRLWVGGSALVGLATAAFWLLTRQLSAEFIFWLTVAVASALLLVAAAIRRQVFQVTPALSALAVTITALVALPGGGLDLPEIGLLTGVGVGAVVSQHLSGRDMKAAATSLIVSVALAGCWALTLLVTETLVQAAAVTGTMTVALLGYLPRLALGWAGLNALDDSRAAGRVIATSDVQQRLEQAHRGMASATLWCGISVAVAAFLILWQQPLDPWGLPLIIVWLVAVALRARAFPLTSQRTSLVAAAMVGAVVIALDLVGHFPQFYWWLGLLLLAASLLAAAPLVLTTPDYFWARLRIVADRTETMATLAMFPLVVGLFGVYSTLLTTFQS